MKTWSNPTLSGNTTIPGGATNLNDLADVAITSPQIGDVLIYDGSNYSNTGTINGSNTDLININANNITSGTLSADRLPNNIHTIYQNDQNTILFLKGDGANNSQIFTDSARGKTISFFGNAKISTDQARIGGSSIYFDGASYLFRDNDPDFSFGNGDFTWEAWVYPERLTGYQTLVGLSTSDSPAIYLLNNTFIGYGLLPSTTNAILAINTWHHVAITRKAGYISLFLNGERKQQGAGANPAVMIASDRLQIGVRGARIAEFFKGFMQYIRLSAFARYTNDFNSDVVYLNI